MPRQPKRITNQKGFSLVEALVSVVVLSLSVFGLTSLSMTSISATRDGRFVSAATTLARSKLEDLRAVGYSYVNSGSDTGPISAEGLATGDAGELMYTRTWVVNTGPTSSTKQITVSVAWTYGSAQQIGLTTLVAE